MATTKKFQALETTLSQHKFNQSLKEIYIQIFSSKEKYHQIKWSSIYKTLKLYFNRLQNVGFYNKKNFQWMEK